MRDERRAKWRQVDEAWYLATYPTAVGEIEANGLRGPLEHYETIGKSFGFSPNPYFDEAWYRQAYPEIYAGICRGELESGFDHYCTKGLTTHSPHWLFSEAYYRTRHGAQLLEALDEGIFENGYDHFLEIGDGSGLSGHWFLDPGVVARHVNDFPVDLSSGTGLFRLIAVEQPGLADHHRVSWYFDPQWYRAQYPEIDRDIEAGRYLSSLHHYLANQTPRQFNPQSSFDEGYYLRINGDVLPSIDNGTFRNGYEHFVRNGASEGRAPAEGINLSLFRDRPQVRAMMEAGRFDSLYACWMEQRVQYGEHSDQPPPDEDQTRRLFEAEAALQSLITRRRGLDFTCKGDPELSVIMVLHDKYALTIQALASLRANYAGPIQLILVDSASSDETKDIGNVVRGATILRYRYNIGYLDGCNAALAHVKAAALLYLNNDLRLYPHATRNALARLHSSPDIGAVGAKLIRSNMWLQEAGSIIWRDGATYGYRRQDNPAIPEANFVRDVDYCSAAFLMVRSDMARALGGFDPIYRPAYFEDTDFCLRMVRAGKRIVYDPGIVVEHLEFGSSGTSGSMAQMKINHRIFSRQHQDYLRQQLPAHVRNAVLARSHRSSKRKILFIEDRIPLRSLGSGYVRSNDLVWAMSALGLNVTVFPVLPRPASQVELAANFPDDVELMAQSDLGDLDAFIEERAGNYDAIWIGRTHNLLRLLPVLTEQSRHLPVDSVILDTEVIAAPRTIAKARFHPPKEKLGSLSEMVSQELEAAQYCQRIVVVSEHDAALARDAGYENVSVLGHSVALRPDPQGFDERRDILFVGALHDVDAPNYDSLFWLINDVLPEMEEHLPEDVRITVAGFVHPSVNVSSLRNSKRVNWIGPVDDLTALYVTHRIFVAPTRYAGGLPYKVHEAASYGLPVVATRLLSSQMGWADGVEIVSASSEDPIAFAFAMAELYENRDKWTMIRAGALRAVERDCNPERFRAALGTIIEMSVAPSRAHN
ncbi:glycosyltransferase [Asaia krungthepensis]|uniref:Glycosyltransferase n=1 Tax=Asaia krungthepensis NRIC 0535 TaxID=1307925 RepID=A0ABQ0Q6A9_9PROT|nr:glycosyltransferase [Asaia krungthepensis]GBQ93377.1 glycosyltransferase [Asaia krungthepensis NRIC 0535]